MGSRAVGSQATPAFLCFLLIWNVLVVLSGIGMGRAWCFPVHHCVFFPRQSLGQPVWLRGRRRPPQHLSTAVARTLGCWLSVALGL